MARASRLRTTTLAYFQQKQPVKGSPQFSFKWMEVTWLFSSAANRDQFATDPQRYAPQYGGYCSYAVSQGHTAPIDPEAWRIVDGKLYINYSKGVQKSGRRIRRAIPRRLIRTGQAFISDGLTQRGGCEVYRVLL